MAPYNLRFNLEALTDIENSLQWGKRNWGEEKGDKMGAGLHAEVQKRLTTFPLSCPLAPESKIRAGSTPVYLQPLPNSLFFVEGREVSILYVRGPFHN
jgi:hypothetical protein